MALLNVQQRRIETKIAYVGPELAGKTTNLRHLTGDSTRGRATNAQLTGDILSLDWSPLSTDARFSDCEVAVKVVATKGTVSSERLDVVLDGADGVVVVVDAAPSAREENRRALELVREAVSRSSTPMPVVVQLNKSDLADAVSATSIPTSFDWPVVPASALRGEGVLETLEVALENVIDVLNKKQSSATPSAATASASASASPLLDALREILRETVSEHAANLESQVAARIADTVQARVERAEAALGEIRAAIVDLSRRVADVQSRDVLTRLDLVEATSDLLTRHELTEHEVRLREDSVTRAKAEREANLLAFKRAVDPALAALKKEVVDLQARSEAASKKELAELNAKVDAVLATTPVLGSLKAVPGRLDQIENALQRELRGTLGAHLSRIGESVESMSGSTSEVLGRTETKANEIHAGLSELLDELKRRKKGWFS